ncbi:hypothetical protein ACIPWL_08125 [Streptomyces sp. NPDC090023]|uniref:hypothetical protein n=1 Tax=unclassified Streptomyces TaxID=2593676 RepID=UPI003800F8BD
MPPGPCNDVLTPQHPSQSWPDRENFTAHFTPTADGDGVHAYRVPGISHPITTADQAKRIATAYAARYAPWADPGAEISVHPVDSRLGAGWTTEWRRRKNDVLMPMRLDIAIEPSGRLIDLIARDVADPDLPQGERRRGEGMAGLRAPLQAQTHSQAAPHPRDRPARRRPPPLPGWRPSVSSGDDHTS